MPDISKYLKQAEELDKKRGISSNPSVMPAVTPSGTVTQTAGPDISAYLAQAEKLDRERSAAPTTTPNTTRADGAGVGGNGYEIQMPKLEVNALGAGGGAREGGNLWDRIRDTLSGGIKQSVGGNVDTMGTMYEATQGQRDTLYDQQREWTAHQLARAEADLAAYTADGNAYMAKVTQGEVERLRTQLNAYDTVKQGQVQQKATTAARDMAAQVTQSGAQDIERAKEGLGLVGQALVDAGASGVQMLGDAGLGALTGVGGLAPMAFRAFGGGTQKARAEGADLDEQILYGGAQAAKEWVTEKLFSVALPFAKTYGKGSLDDVVEKSIGKAVDRFAKSALGKRALGGGLTLGAAALGEGLEEGLGTFLEWQLPRIYGGDVASFGETLEEAAYNTLVGSLSGLAGGVVTPQVWNYQQTAPQTAQGGEEAAQEGQNAPVTGNETPAPAEGAQRPQNTPMSFENTAAADILMGAAPQKQRAGFTSLENAMANQFEQETGISIESVESILGGLANGDYNSANWVARIAQDAKDPKMVVVAHELTHHLQTLAPQEYESFRAAVADYFTRAGGEAALTDMMNRYRSAYGAAGQNLSDSAVMDELAADFTEVLLTDADLFGQFARENRTVAERLLDALRAFIEKIRTTFTGRARDAAAQEATGKTLNELEMIAEQWQGVYRAAAAAYGQNANTATQEGDGVRYEIKDYSYNGLTSKPDMSLTVINSTETKNMDRKTVLDKAAENARKIGNVNKQGNIMIRVNDTGTDVVLSNRALRHGLDRRFPTNAPVTLKAGQILQNAIQINELTPKRENISKSYVLVGAAKNEKNEPYIVQFVVNRATNEVTEIDVLYAVNAKTEPAGSLSPKITGVPATLTGSNISIANLLDYVNRYFPDVLPEDVLKHYGHSKRPAGELGKNALYSLNTVGAEMDSDGRQLSEGQKAYFANSKSVDAQGRLRVMYRGGNSNFTVFDRKKSSYANLYGRGFYFTDSKSHAEQYGGAREFYLNITNPVPTDEQTITREQLLNFLQAVAENEDDYSFENYGYGATPESMVDAIYSGKSDFAMLYDVSQTAIGDMVEAVELFNEINGTDFDGLILDTETVIFNSEQAKLTDNKTPTDNPDIRFSLKKGLDDYLSDLEAVNTEIAEHQKRGIFAAEREGGNEGVLAYIKKKDALAAKKRRIERIIRDLSQPVVESAEQIDSKAFKLWFGDWPNGKGSKVVDADGKPLVVYHGTGTTIEEFLPEFTGKGNDQYGSGFYFTTNESTATGYTTRTLNGQEKPGGSDNPNVIPVYLNIRHPLIVDAAKTSNLYDVDVSPVMASRIISRMPDIMDPAESILGDFFEEYWEIGPKNYMISRLAREYEWTLGSLANDIFRDYPTEFRQAVKEVLGYDGVQVNFSNGEKHFVAWFPNQIKHATENSGAFSKKDNRIKASLKSTAPLRKMMAEMPQQMMIRIPRLTTVAQDEAEAAGVEAAPVEDTVQLPQLGLTDADVPGTEPLTRQDIAREMAWRQRMANEPAAPQVMGEVKLPDLSEDMEEAGMGVADFTGNVETVPQEATAEILSALEDLSRDMEAPMETPTDATVRDAESLISAETVEAPQSLKEKAAESWAFFKRKMVDSGEAVTQIGKAINDKYLYPFYNMARASASAGANMIAEEQTDVNGRTVGESLNAIFDPIRAKGKDYYVNFQTYMYDLHNIARMSMDKNAQKERDAAEAAKAEFLAEHPKFINMTREQARRKADSIDELEAEEAREYLRLERWQNRAASMGNKPVFDYEFSAEMSRGRSERLLREHPEFAQYREQVRKYIDNLMKYRVDSGLMTQKNADFLREYYPDYVPTDRHQAFEDFGPEIKEKRVRIAKTVKRAKGGNEKLVPLHEALGKQTMQVVREGSKNRFGARLLQDYTANASDAGIAKYIRDAKETEADFDINSFDEEKKTKENTFSVYFDGKLYEMEVNDALLEAVQALSPSDNLMKYWPVELSHNLNKLYKAMITGYNPTFAIRNTVRDLQTAGLYSRNFAAWAKNYPKALQEIAKDGEMWKQYKALGGDFSSVYDYATGTVRKPNTMVGKVADKMQALNMAMEQAPRLAEFMAVMEKGDGSMESAMDAMLAAADVTTNFGRSGTWGKVLNAHIVPFLNPGIQGFDKMVRYATQSRSGKQWLMMAARAAALGIAPSLINALLYHDDEEWEELRDSDKDTNYMFKLKDGLWLKIPKGRELSVLGIAADRVGDAIRGEDVNIRATLNTIGTQVAPANPLNENIAKAWLDADLFNPSSPGRTWYGGDIEGQRLQNYAPGERYDSSTDVVSKAIGGALNLSPKKLNYLADQYTGVVGDIVLPLLTPQAERDMFSKAFTVDSISSNELSSKFYEKADELTYAKYGGDAVAAVVSRYWNSISSDVSKLYGEIRNVENSDLSNREKKERVQELQRQINAIQREALATVDQYTAAVESSLFGDDEDAADFAYRETNREVFGAKSALETYNKDVYAKAQEAAKNGVSYEAYYDYYFATKDIEGDKDASGKTIPGSKREKVLAEINAMDLTVEQKNALYYASGYAESTLYEAPWYTIQMPRL